METLTENPNPNPARKKEIGCFYYVLIVLVMGFFSLLSQHNSSDELSGSYIKPHHTRTGKLLKGHVRKKFSTSPNAQRSRNNSKKFRHLHPGRYDKK